MIFTISASILLSHLNKIGGAVGVNSSMPILEDILFDLQDSTLKLSATDLETSMSTRIDVMGAESGLVAIPCKILTDIIKSLPDQPITFHVNEENYNIQLSTSNGKFHITGENGEEFPVIPEPGAAKELVINTTVLDTAINNTLFAVSTDELRRTMTGVLFELGTEGINFVATDAHKLAKYRRTDLNYDEESSFVMPKKALNLINKSLPNDGSAIKIAYDYANAFFTYGDTRLVCRLIDGKYPNYTAVIPIDNPHRLLVNRGDLLNSLRRISLFANKDTYQVHFDIKENELVLSAQDLDYSNKGQERLDCQYNGDDLEIAFNARFLGEILNTLNSEEVCFKLETSSRAVLIEPLENLDDEVLTMLIMPIMLD